MKKVRIAIVVSAVLVVAGPSAAVAQEPDAQVTLFRNARLLPAGSGTLAEGMSVLVEGDRITRVASSIPAPEGATVIDATARVMAPGVIDLQGNPYPTRLGAIEEGAPASLFLVDGNPLDDNSLLMKPGPHLVLIMTGGKIQKDASGTESTGAAAELEIPENEMKEPQKTLLGDELVADDFKGSWPMFGTNMRMKVGGYIKADVVADIDGTLDKTQFLMSTIPIEGTPEHDNSGYFYMFAKETRFNIDVRRATPGAVPLRMFVEGDFFTSTGNQFRLRHAYLVAGNFMVGQTWTTLSFLEALPVMIDFAAGDALFGGRTTQIRFQKKVSDQWKLAVAAENLDYMGIENPSGLPGRPSAALPLLAVRADLHWSTGLLLLGSSIGQLRWDGGATGPDATAVQVDGLIGGRQYLGKDDYVTWHFSYGVGSGENVMAFAGSHANAVLTPEGRLDTMPAFAFVLGYSHKWSPTLSSVASYAYGWLQTSESRTPLALKDGGIGHANLVWRPVEQFATGVEYMWGSSRATNRDLGSARRVQLMVRFDF